MLYDNEIDHKTFAELYEQKSTGAKTTQKGTMQ
jgi:hypothetical protein